MTIYINSNKAKQLIQKSILKLYKILIPSSNLLRLATDSHIAGVIEEEPRDDEQKSC